MTVAQNGEARVHRGSRVEESSVAPCFTLVGAGANGERDAFLGTSGVGEEDVAAGVFEKARHAGGVCHGEPRFAPFPVEQVGFPLPACPRADAGAGFVTHAEEQGAVFELDDAAFAGLWGGWDCGGRDVPGLATVLTGDEAGVSGGLFLAVGQFHGFLELGGENEGAVAELDTTARAVEAEAPRGIFHLSREVDGGRPREPVVGAFDEDELSGFFGVEAGSATEPRAGAVGPEGDDEDGAGALIDEDGGVADAVALGVGGGCVEVDDALEGAPGVAVVGRAHHADVDIAGEVRSVAVSGVEDGDEGTGGGGGEAGDAVGVNAVGAVFSEGGSEDARVVGEALGLRLLGGREVGWGAPLGAEVGFGVVEFGAGEGFWEDEEFGDVAGEGFAGGDVGSDDEAAEGRFFVLKNEGMDLPCVGGGLWFGGGGGGPCSVGALNGGTSRASAAVEEGAGGFRRNAGEGDNGAGPGQGSPIGCGLPEG